MSDYDYDDIDYDDIDYDDMDYGDIDYDDETEPPLKEICELYNLISTWPLEWVIKT